jgi:unsaturated rhamnogalacturonyl hydrolase
MRPGAALAAAFLLTGFAGPALPADEGPTPPPVPKPMSVRLADAVIATWPDPRAISDKGWEYTTGIVLRGIAEVYRKNRDPRYLDYIRRFVDSHLREDGGVDWGADAAGHNLDRMQPGVLLLLLYEETGATRYARAARCLRARVDRFPRNKAGGFWHKQKYPEEMWLDGLYMAEPFLVRYARDFSEPSLYDEAVRQIRLAAEHTRVPGGLFRHAWDEDRNATWADPATGVSPEVWGRAMGWFVMALVDILADLPPDHPGRSELVALLREAAGGIRATQDPKSGLWFQVLDKRDHPDNWLETSASGMFVYALSKGVALGVLDGSFTGVTRAGEAGLLDRISDDSVGRPVVAGAVEGMSVQKDLAGYLSRRRLANSPHGLCAALLATSAVEAAR